MKFKIQVVAVSDDGREQTREIASLERDDLRPETLGLTLAESKAILKDCVFWRIVNTKIIDRLSPEFGDKPQRLLKAAGWRL